MKCTKCGREIMDGEEWDALKADVQHISCPLKAERSEVLQGCPPSANCSAGAGADAQPNSLISSPVPREKAVLSGVELIEAERQRQISKEGWSEKHDDGHKRMEMSQAAVAYTKAAVLLVLDIQSVNEISMTRPMDWPWGLKWWKPSTDPKINLVKAGALIAAEIDRLQRLEAGQDAGPCSHCLELARLEGKFEQLLSTTPASFLDEVAAMLKDRDQLAARLVVAERQRDACHEQFKHIYTTLPLKLGGYSGSECVDEYFKVIAHLAEMEKALVKYSQVVDSLLNHCGVGECEECSKIVCPYNEPLHFHHDGCPACCNPDESGCFKYFDVLTSTPSDSLNRLQELECKERAMDWLESKNDYYHIFRDGLRQEWTVGSDAIGGYVGKGQSLLSAIESAMSQANEEKK